MRIRVIAQWMTTGGGHWLCNKNYAFIAVSPAGGFWLGGWAPMGMCYRHPTVWSTNQCASRWLALSPCSMISANWQASWSNLDHRNGPNASVAYHKYTDSRFSKKWRAGFNTIREKNKREPALFVIVSSNGDMRFLFRPYEIKLVTFRDIYFVFHSTWTLFSIFKALCKMISFSYIFFIVVS